MRKSKKTSAKPIIITFVCLIIFTLVAFAVFIGYNKYELSSHPTLYSELVERYSSQYGLDKYEVYSFILT